MSRGPWKKADDDTVNQNNSTGVADLPSDPRLQVYREVWLVNEMDHEYVEKVMGEEYRIPAGERIRMRRHEAVKVRGNFPGEGVEKSLKIIPIYPTAEQAGIKFVSPVDGKEFKTQKELDEYHKAMRDKLKVA